MCIIFYVSSASIVFVFFYSDMKSLVLEVLSGSLMVAVGRVQVDHIYLLAPSKPING